MPNISLNDQISSLVLAVVRQQDPDLADMLEALTASSNAEAWKKAGDQLLDWAINTPAVADAQFGYILASSCFERYVALSR
ncbi:hypothetical protein [Aeromonas sp. PrichA-15]|uniref:hypothetical protein n=1 Tax=Aeromonas sp. PrichA-15 TaxID=2823360 RepID=UPI001B31A0CC|nr:hypothetical protein [Aeromonas sp. PrichA-15]MBP4034462.1 hypothetical protein [Aeromonas sp. PrichA-15]